MNINESDKAVLLSTISVAKYSSNYWYEGFIQTGGSSKLSLNSLLNTLANVTAIIVGDSIAAAAGAGTGILISGLTGGAAVGAIPTLTVAFAAAASGYIGTHPPF